MSLLFVQEKLLNVGVHKYINFCSLKTYEAGDYKKSLGQSIFPNYDIFDNVNAAHSDFFQKIDSY